MKRILLPLVFLLALAISSCVSLSPVNPASLDTTAFTKKVLLSKKVQTQLKQQLKPYDYHQFNLNLKDFSASTRLRDGSVFYEARRDKLNAVSAVVLHPNGYFYLAYKQPNATSITYITNDGICNEEVHDAIKVASKVMMTQPKVTFSRPTEIITTAHSCEAIYGRLDLKSPVFISK